MNVPICQESKASWINAVWQKRNKQISYQITDKWNWLFFAQIRHAIDAIETTCRPRNSGGRKKIPN